MIFTANISRFEESDVFWTSIIIIPEGIFLEMIKHTTEKRIICTINNSLTFHCAMIPKKPFHYIMLSKEKIKALKLAIHEEISVKIFPDASKFDMEISDEFQEVLFSDSEGNLLFEKLTSSKKRSILYLIYRTKNPQLKIEKSFVVLEHLKRYKGKFDLLLFNEDYKSFRDKNKLKILVFLAIISVSISNR